MKSERRHELQQNDLAMYLNRLNKQVEPYSRVIAGALLVVVIGALGLMFYNASQTENRSDATFQLIQALASQDPEVFEVVTSAYPDTAASSWARLYQGQRFLAQGINDLYSDRPNAEDLLNSAKTTLRTAIENSSDPLLRSRAHFGIARAHESLGELDEAIAEYEKVITIAESDAMVEKCRDRIDSLSRPETREFLAWFADQDFSPADPSLPPALDGIDTLPDMPDLELPGLGLELGDGETSSESLEGGLELPEESDAADQSDADAEMQDEPALDLPDEPAPDTPQAEAPQAEAESAEADAPQADADNPEPAADEGEASTGDDN